MDQRLYQVFLTYVQRWQLLLTAVLYVAVSVAAVCIGPLQMSPSTLRKVSPTFPLPRPLKKFSDLSELERTSDSTRSVFVSTNRLQNSKPITLKQLPRLSSLEILGVFQSGDDMAILRSMPNLQAFSYSSNLPWNCLRYVAEAQDLRYLQLLALKPDQGLSDLRRLQKLDVLEIRQIEDYRLLFNEIRHLPNLRTLILPGPKATTFQGADWEQLRSVPRLQYLYLEGNIDGPEYTRIEVDQIQQALPQVKVRPSPVNDRRTRVWTFIAFASMLASGVLIMQLQTHFAHVQSRIIPNYTTSHLLVPIVFWTLSTIFNTVILWYANCSFAASLAGSLIVPGLYWWLTVAMLRSAKIQNQASTFSPYFTAMMCFQVLPNSVTLSSFFLGDIDWFLSGRQPVLAWGITIASVIAPAMALRRIPRLHSLYAECSAGVPPLGLSWKAWNVWGKNLAGSQEGTWGTRLRSRRSAALDSLLATRNPTETSKLWIAGNEQSGWQLCMRLLMMGTAAFLFIQVFRLLGYTDPTGGALLMLSAAGIIYVDIFPLAQVIVWRRRRSLLGYELLRPSNRQDFVRQLFAAMARDQRPFLVLHLLWIVVIWQMSTITHLPPWMIPGIICFCVFRGLSIYAYALLVLAVKPIWIVIVCLPIVWSLLSFSSAYLALGCTRPENWSPTIAIPLFLTGIAFALLGLVWIRRYWERLELA
ncbi:MAG: hypothetical protein V4719_00290 [Planctomycetota bacterium]